MDKKGASHADWAISLGIFLVYILSLFLIIQPGVEPIYREDALLQIVEDAFLGEMNSTITRATLMITPVVGNYEVPDTGEVRVVALEGFPFTDPNTNHYAVNTSVPGKRVINHETGDMFSTDTLFFTSEIEADASKNMFYLLHSQDYDYDQAGLGVSCTTNKVSAIPGVCDDNDAANFTLTMGATEVLKGLGKDKIDAVACSTKEEYEALKSKWNFPFNKEFDMYYVMGSSPKYGMDEIIPICTVVNPGNQTSVFVNEFGSWLLDADGNRQAVRVNIRIW